MRTTRFARRLSLRARLTAVALFVTLAILLGSRVLETVGGFSHGLGWTATGTFLGAMAIAVGGVTAFHPFARLGPANLVTTARMALVALIAALLVESPAAAVATTTVIVASAAATLDGWDGWLARRTRMASAFGARFDMEVDALLILLLGFCAWRHDKAGAWILLSGALRYGFVVAGWTTGWFRRVLPPSTRRKAVCVIQIVGLIVAISPTVPRPFSAMIGGVSLAVLVWSFAVDVMWLWHARSWAPATSAHS